MKKFFFLLLLIGCSPNSSEDFYAEGSAKTQQLVKILEKVETKQDLKNARPILRKKFNEITDLILQAENFQKNEPGVRPLGPNPYSGDLLRELKRIYTIDGGRELMESIEREPLIQLSK